GGVRVLPRSHPGAMRNARSGNGDAGPVRLRASTGVRLPRLTRGGSRAGQDPGLDLPADLSNRLRRRDRLAAARGRGSSQGGGTARSTGSRGSFGAGSPAGRHWFSAGLYSNGGESLGVQRLFF